jgi:ferritin
LAHEREVTAMINNLNSLAVEEKDYATESMLRWFIDEQVEEEETAQSLIDALKMIKDNGFGLYTLDKELASRVYSPVTTA